MTNQSFQSQFESFKRMAQQSGMSGVAYIDFNPADGFLRVKLKVTPIEKQSELISSFSTALAQLSQIFGLQVKIHKDDDGKVGAEA